MDKRMSLFLLVIQKKFIVIARSGLDITSEILEIFNKENK